jgi:glycosyltransferase involved in cell wall biosynthesis
MIVSIVITAYNYARYLERAIRSCMEQSMPQNTYEIIVVNDCSTDETKEILENFNEECRIYNLEKNIGLSAARNFGIKKAKGQFVIFLDADDYIQKDLIYIQKTFLCENNSIDAISTDYFIVDEKGNHIEHVNAETLPIACGIMFRKDLLFDIGLYDENFRAREEEDLRLRFLKNHSIYNLILPLYRYRKHGNNLTDNIEEMNLHAKKLKTKHNT